MYLKSALKCDSFDVAIDIKFQFFEFWLLLSRVAPYYSSLPRTVWNIEIGLDSIIKYLWKDSISKDIKLRKEQETGSYKTRNYNNSKTLKKKTKSFKPSTYRS